MLISILLRKLYLFVPALVFMAAFVSVPASAGQTQRPNILVIWGDDIGYWNLSTNNDGMMGYETPNIDSIADQGAKFTDAYSEQSCTAGRSAFITGQHPIRTGLLKVGLPGAKEGLSEKDPTIATMLKPHGYATAQIGKNHLGDRNDFLPTLHGFDEFFGNLYHLNAEEEPENPDYPKDPEFNERFGARGVLDCVASDKDDLTEDPRFGKMGKQVCEDTGPLTKKRMETVETELLDRSLDFMTRSVESGKPFFLWHNTTRMHNWTHLSDKYANKTGLGLYPDGMAELEETALDLLEHDFSKEEMELRVRDLALKFEPTPVIQHRIDAGIDFVRVSQDQPMPFADMSGELVAFLVNQRLQNYSMWWYGQAGQTASQLLVSQGLPSQEQYLSLLTLGNPPQAESESMDYIDQIIAGEA